MSFLQVAAILGSPKPGDMTETQDPGVTLTTWKWPFVLSSGSAIYSVTFLNEMTADKAKVLAHLAQA